MENQNNQIQVANNQQRNDVSVFASTPAFEAATRMAQALAKSEIVPKVYQGNVANTLVALEMANRMQVSPLMVMQNLDIIHGKPSFNAKFTAALVNSTGRYSALRYQYSGEGDSRTCVAVAKELSTGETLFGPPVSINMAKKEGWYGKSGSKWPTMPDLMLMYRAGTFWQRQYEPGITMGMPSSDELEDIGPGYNTVQSNPVTSAAPVSEANEKLNRRKAVTKKMEDQVAEVTNAEGDNGTPPDDDEFM